MNLENLGPVGSAERSLQGCRERNRFTVRGRIGRRGKLSGSGGRDHRLFENGRSAGEIACRATVYCLDVMRADLSATWS